MTSSLFMAEGAGKVGHDKIQRAKGMRVEELVGG